MNEETKMENRYLTIEMEINGQHIQVQVKLDDEGVVLDVFDENEEELETKAKTYEEFGIKTISFNE